MAKRNVESAGSCDKSHGLDFVGETPYDDQPKAQEMIRQEFRYYNNLYLKGKVQKETPKTLPEKVATRRNHVRRNGSWWGDIGSRQVGRPGSMRTIL